METIRKCGYGRAIGITSVCLLTLLAGECLYWQIRRSQPVVININVAGIQVNITDQVTTYNNNITKQVAEYVENNTTESDKISVYGHWDIIYIKSNRLHATKYSYQFPLVTIRPTITKEYLEQLELAKPKVIVVQKGHKDKHITAFLDKHKYEIKYLDGVTLCKRTQY